MRFKCINKIRIVIYTNDDKVGKVVWGRGKKCRSCVGWVLVLSVRRKIQKLTKTCAIPG